MNLALTGGYLLEPSKGTISASLSGWTNSTTDRRGVWRLHSPSTLFIFTLSLLLLLFFSLNVTKEIECSFTIRWTPYHSKFTSGSFYEWWLLREVSLHFLVKLPFFCDMSTSQWTRTSGGSNTCTSSDGVFNMNLPLWWVGNCWNRHGKQLLHLDQDRQTRSCEVT